MNKLVKSLLLSLIVSAPVAITLPAVQAFAAPTAKTSVVALHSTGTKSVKAHKVRHHRHRRHHYTRKAH